MSQFAFLAREGPEVGEAAAQAEALAYPDPRTACFYARRALELAVHWLYKADATLKLPYQEHLSALIHAPSFRAALGPICFAKVRLIKDLGNLAVHSHKPMRAEDGLAAVQAFAGFLSGKTLSANQIEFVNLIINHLTEHGVMDAALLYESPFTDLTPQGPDGLFASAQVDELVSLLREIRARAVA